MFTLVVNKLILFFAFSFFHCNVLPLLARTNKSAYHGILGGLGLPFCYRSDNILYGKLNASVWPLSNSISVIKFVDDKLCLT